MRRIFTGIVILSFLAAAGIAAGGISIAADEAESLKAYRGFNFKDSVREVYDKLKEDNKVIGQAEKFNYRLLQHIMNKNERETGARFIEALTTVEKERFNIKFYFHGEQLYKLFFRGPYYSAGRADNAVRDRQLLVNIIEQKYGQPAVERKINYKEIQPGTRRFSHKWQLPERDVEIRIGSGADEAYHYAVMIIKYIPLYREKQEEGQQDTNSPPESTADF